MSAEYQSYGKALTKSFEAFKKISDLEYVDSIINVIPCIGAILNHNREIVYANKELLNLISAHNLENIVGKRPGELLNCINTLNSENVCGSSESCNLCGIKNTIIKCQKTRERAIGECRVTVEMGDGFVSLDYRVTAIPIYLNEEEYIVFSMIDISDEKRRQVLEKIFFHDLMNKVGYLQTVVELIDASDEGKKHNEMIALLSLISSELVEEVKAQQQLHLAENNELTISPFLIDSIDLLRSVINQIKIEAKAKSKHIILSEDSTPCTFQTDETLLKRILLNMAKNALEASEKGQIVTIGSTIQNKKIKFWVHNSCYIPRDVQLQIFMRSFSTKGANRGVGTYSMKLLGERYLNGKVGFTTNELSGTEFFIILPFA